LCCPEQIFFSVRLLKRSKEKQATHRPISEKNSFKYLQQCKNVKLS
jgi:hypothetical protein